MNRNKTNKEKYGIHECVSGVGKCRKVQDDIVTPQKEVPYIVGKFSTGMTWWTANNFCKALGKDLLKVNDYNCPKWNCSVGDCSSFGPCKITGSAWNVNPEDLSDILTSIKEAYGEGFGFWTQDGPDECRKLWVDFGSAYIIHSFGLIEAPSTFSICK